MVRGYFREKDKNRIELKPHDKFGYLEVIKLSDKRTKDGHILYEFLCHGCNNVVYLLAKDVIIGIAYSTLKKRIYVYKWDDIKALTTKVRYNGKKGNN